MFDTALPSTIGHGTVHTRLSYSKAGPLGPWEWVDPAGLLAKPAFIPNGKMKEKEFDDHIIFPAHIPFTVQPPPPLSSKNGTTQQPAVVRVYYMGGNGPHNGARNTSLGLATLRADGFSGISGTSASSFQTTSKVKVTGKYLRVSVDRTSAGGDDVTATVFVLLSPVSAEAMLAADSAAVKQPVISES